MLSGQAGMSLGQVIRTICVGVALFSARTFTVLHDSGANVPSGRQDVLRQYSSRQRRQSISLCRARRCHWNILSGGPTGGKVGACDARSRCPASGDRSEHWQNPCYVGPGMRTTGIDIYLHHGLTHGEAWLAIACYFGLERQRGSSEFYRCDLERQQFAQAAGLSEMDLEVDGRNTQPLAQMRLRPICSGHFGHEILDRAVEHFQQTREIPNPSRVAVRKADGEGVFKCHLALAFRCSHAMIICWTSYGRRVRRHAFLGFVVAGRRAATRPFPIIPFAACLLESKRSPNFELHTYRIAVDLVSLPSFVNEPF